MHIKENDELLEYFINEYFIKQFKENYYNRDDIPWDRLELYITPECNQVCRYCYVYMYGKYTYPIEIVNHEAIINNIKKVHTYFKLNKLYLRDLDIFSGEIWGDKFGLDILELFYDLYCDYKMSERIVIPSNMSFIFADGVEEKIEEIINKFEDIGIRLVYSASVDGIYLDNDMRAFNPNSKMYDLVRDQSYYDRIFNFCSRHDYLFHPMVSSKSCKYWCENYDWYVEMYKKYFNGSHTPMMLEVRNDDWTDEDIEYFKKFLKHVIDYRFNVQFNRNIEKFTNTVAKIKDYNSSKYDNISLVVQSERINCGIQNSWCIRCGDLAMLPCHRTSYLQNIIGYLDFDGNKMSVLSNNVELAIQIYSMNPNIAHPTCDTCVYRRLCNKGCLVAQYEANKDLVMPCKSVCKMLKAKIDFLIDYYTELGVVD